MSVQFSAITNCDAAQSTRPFIVRWTAGATTYLFRKTVMDESRCNTFEGSSFNGGTGFGTVNGGPAFLAWEFYDHPQEIDEVIIDVGFGGFCGSNTCNGLQTVGTDPLKGTPGGVWVFGELPWPEFGS